MLSSLFLDLTKDCLENCHRAEGAAFLKASTALYNMSTLCYMSLNIPMGSGQKLRHCIYSDRSVRQKTSLETIDACRLEQLGLVDGDPVDWSESPLLETEFALARANLGESGKPLRIMTFCIATSHKETALLGLASSASEQEWADLKHISARDIRILATYFHNHILRLNGIDSRSEILISARELDCLKWTAAGKTAWEASRILGISERTVRFHLNSAREKMNCANTTQAVATAISRQLISV